MHGPRKNTDVIVAAIIAELEPLQSGVSRTDAEGTVRTHLQAMQEIDRVLFDLPALKKNRDSAKRIRKTIRRLKYQIAVAPGPIKTTIYVGDDPRLDGPPPPTVLEMLGWMDERLAEHVALSAGPDHSKASSASRAHMIMKECSQKIPASSSQNSPLRVIASLIYEHCTGKQQDLERACEAALREARKVARLNEILDASGAEETWDNMAAMRWRELLAQYTMWRRRRKGID